MPSEIMSMLMPSPKTGLTFYARTPLGAYRETIPGKVVASTLMVANTDPARGGMPNRGRCRPSGRCFGRGAGWTTCG